MNFWNILLFLIGILTATGGTYRIFNIEKISIGKNSSRLLASIIATCTFFSFDEISIYFPHIEHWSIYGGFTILVLFCLFKFYQNYKSEVEQIKEDTEIFIIIALIYYIEHYIKFKSISTLLKESEF